MVNALALAALLATSAFVPIAQEGDTLPAVPLVDRSGHAFSLAALRGNAVILSFIYTRCADATMCPLVSLKYARMQRAIGRAPVRLVEITLDPQFDTPHVLDAYARNYGANSARWTLATGAPASIEDLAARLGIASAWTRPGSLVHTEATVVLDPSGAVARIVDGTSWTPQAMLALARESAGAAPAPFARAALWLTAAIERCGGGSIPLSALEAIALVAALTIGFGTLLIRSLRPQR